MIKKFIMKLIRKNKNLREYIINGCIAEDLFLPEQKSEIIENMKFNTTIADTYLKGKTLILNNCLFINTKIENNNIHGEFKIINPYNTCISNNTGIQIIQEEESVKIPDFMK